MVLEGRNLSIKNAIERLKEDVIEGVNKINNFIIKKKTLDEKLANISWDKNGRDIEVKK